MTPGPGVPYFGAEVDEAVLISDGIEPIVAYRAWQLDADGTIRSFHWLCDEVWSTSEGSVRGVSGTESTPIPTSRSMRCQPRGAGAGSMRGSARRTSGRSSPRTPFLPSGQPFGPLYASGVVELAGKVIEHEFGYRAERARIVGVLPISPFMERRWRRFGKHWVWDRWPDWPEGA
jgi:hypothetical protein